MIEEPAYHIQKKRVYTTYQTYRRLRDVLIYTERHIYPDQEPFPTLLKELAYWLEKNSIPQTKRVARKLSEEWMKWRHKL